MVPRFTRKQRTMRSTPTILGLLIWPIAWLGGGSRPAGDPPSAVILLNKCTISYQRATQVGSNQNGGLIQECLVQPGENVKAGQVLGRLFNRDVLVEIEIHTALEASEIAIRQREAALEVETAKLRRAESLISRKALSMQDYQIQRLEVQNRSLDLKAAIQARRMVATQLDQGKALAAARELVSPYDGVVVEVYKNVGEALTVGSPAFRVVQVGRMRVTGFLNTGDACGRASRNARPGDARSGGRRLAD